MWKDPISGNLNFGIWITLCAMELIYWGEFGNTSKNVRKVQNDVKFSSGGNNRAGNI